MIAALAAITGRLGPIEKLTPAERRKRGMSGGGEEGGAGIKYAYRGVDQVATELQPLLGEYGVVIVPRIGSHEIDQIEVGGKPWTSHRVMVHWTIYGPGGVDDHIEATTLGEGRDNSDKGVNKATTAAYKNLLLRMFSIGDPAEDPDNERHETSAAPPQQRVDHNAEAIRVFESLRDLANDERVAAALKVLKRDNSGRDFKETSLRDPQWRALVERTVADARTSALPKAEAGEVDENLEYGDEEEPGALGEALGEGLS